QKSAQRDQNRRSHQYLGVNGARLGTCNPSSQLPGTAQENPHSQSDQENRKNQAVEKVKIKQPQITQQEEHAQGDQNHSARGHVGKASLPARAQHLSQAERIGSRLPNLQRLGGTIRVHDLVDVKEGN